MKNIIAILLTALLIISCKTKTKENTIETRESKPEEEIVNTPLAIRKRVAAKSGLNYRQKPKGKVISKFKYNQEVIIVEKTGVIEEITDNGDLITGEWVGVKHNKKTVYLFDAFLAEPKEKEIKKPLVLNPIDNALLTGYIIKPGKYHKEEIPDKITTQDWFGIFKENGNYMVEKTTINILSVHDAIVDNEGEKTGKKIISNNNKECYLLMNNISYLTEIKIDTILTKPTIIHPEKPFSYQTNNIEYTLSATADEYNPLNKDNLFFNPKNYNLFLEKNTNGVITKQLLLFENRFDDQITKILFIGDIDGDTIPDLLIDSANHYNASVPTLYLSKEAKTNEILKIVSLHEKVGS